jgi:type VI secretion system secreted protein VgrG
MNRVLVANTSLGKTWWAVSLQGSEALSSLYGFRLELKSKKSDIDTQSLIGEACSVACEGNLRAIRHFSGFIVNASARGKVDDHWFYELLIAPKLWHASRRADFRIFQNQTVQAIADQILQQNAILYEWRLKNSYKTWEYVVQYGETDLAFLLRLFGHEGVYFWFEHNPDGEKLILGDHFSTHEPFGGYAAIPFYPPDASRVNEDHFHTWHASRVPESGKYVHTNYDFKQPSKDLKAEFTEPRGHLFDQYEIFAYPGTYVEPEQQFGQDYAMARLHGLQTEQDTIVLEGAVRGVIPGSLFSLTKHPVQSHNREYIITRAEYRARNSDYEATGRSRSEEASFYARVSAIPGDRQYRLPPGEIKMPRAHGPDTAVVVGPPGSEIHTDEYGRVKVHFHWDRYGQKDGNDSCWIRVSYPWAGSGFGGIQIPRVGQEVIIDYEHGDPQRPLVVGRVYNAKQMPPWSLPANKTQSGIMSRTSPGGGADNTNAIRFEDAKGKEEMWVRAERDRRLEVKRNESTWVGNDRTQQVDGQHVEQVKKSIAVSSGANISHTAGGGILLEAKTKIVFKVGGSSIEMNADGTITISGPTRVDIN